MTQADLISLLVAWLPFVVLLAVFALMGRRLSRQYAENLRLSAEAIAVLRENTQALRDLSARLGERA